MSHLHPSLLSAYNSLTDKHLAGYFNNTRIRQHLLRVGLITRSGSIVPDKEYRYKLMRRYHQRHMRESLAQAIFHKVLDVERHHQIEIKRKLEDFAQKERVHKIKTERSKRYEEDVVALRSPKPPSGPRNSQAQHSGPELEPSDSSDSPGSSRPNTAPGKMQRPVRLQPIHSSSTTASTRRPRDTSQEAELHAHSALDRETTRHVTIPKFSSGISPYRLPVINNFVTPVPPPTKRKDRNFNGASNGTTRGRRLRPTTAPIVPEMTKDSRLKKTSLHSNVSVTMMFFGKTVHLSHDDIDMRDEVKVFQQHCGGENLCIYKGKLMEGEAFQFVSRRHRGFPFSLTFFLNGMQVDRLSSCCEFRHRKGSRLGGKHGHFGFTSVDGASPCYRCIIAMGLDKKPTPPPKRIKEDPEELGVGVSREGLTDKVNQESGSQKQAEDDCMDTDVKGLFEEKKAKDDYEEDFEVDDERAEEDTEETSAAVNGNFSSPSNEGRESTIEKDDNEGDPCKSDEDEKGRYSDSESDEERQTGEKRSSLITSGSASFSSGSSKEDSDSEAEEMGEASTDNDVRKTSTSSSKAERREKDKMGEDEEEQVCEQNDEKNATLPEEGKEIESLDDPIEAKVAGNSKNSSTPYAQTPTIAEVDPETQDSLRLGTGKTGMEESGDQAEEGGGPVNGEQAISLPKESSEEAELERAKSVQEKLAAAVIKVAQCSSEPELSDTSTDEEEDPTRAPGETLEPACTGVVLPLQQPASKDGGGGIEEIATETEEAENAVLYETGGEGAVKQNGSEESAGRTDEQDAGDAGPACVDTESQEREVGAGAPKTQQPAAMVRADIEEETQETEKNDLEREETEIDKACTEEEVINKTLLETADHQSEDPEYKACTEEEVINKTLLETADHQSEDPEYKACTEEEVINKTLLETADHQSEDPEYKACTEEEVINKTLLETADHQSEDPEYKACTEEEVINKTLLETADHQSEDPEYKACTEEEVINKTLLETADHQSEDPEYKACTEEEVINKTLLETADHQSEDPEYKACTEEEVINKTLLETADHQSEDPEYKACTEEEVMSKTLLETADHQSEDPEYKACTEEKVINKTKPEIVNLQSEDPEALVKAEEKAKEDHSNAEANEASAELTEKEVEETEAGGDERASPATAVSDVNEQDTGKDEEVVAEAEKTSVEADVAGDATEGAIDDNTKECSDTEEEESKSEQADGGEAEKTDENDHSKGTNGEAIETVGDTTGEAPEDKVGKPKNFEVNEAGDQNNTQENAGDEVQSVEAKVGSEDAKSKTKEIEENTEQDVTAANHALTFEKEETDNTTAVQPINGEVNDKKKHAEDVKKEMEITEDENMTKEEDSTIEEEDDKARTDHEIEEQEAKSEEKSQTSEYEVKSQVEVEEAETANNGESAAPDGETGMGMGKEDNEEIQPEELEARDPELGETASEHDGFVEMGLKKVKNEDRQTSEYEAENEVVDEIKEKQTLLEVNEGISGSMQKDKTSVSIEEAETHLEELVSEPSQTGSQSENGEVKEWDTEGKAEESEQEILSANADQSETELNEFQITESESVSRMEENETDLDKSGGKRDNVLDDITKTVEKLKCETEIEVNLKETRTPKEENVDGDKDPEEVLKLDTQDEPELKTQDDQVQQQKESNENICKGLDTEKDEAEEGEAEGNTEEPVMPEDPSDNTEKRMEISETAVDDDEADASETRITGIDTVGTEPEARAIKDVSEEEVRETDDSDETGETNCVISGSEPVDPVANFPGEKNKELGDLELEIGVSEDEIKAENNQENTEVEDVLTNLVSAEGFQRKTEPPGPETENSYEEKLEITEKDNRTETDVWIKDAQPEGKVDAQTLSTEIELLDEFWMREKVQSEAETGKEEFGDKGAKWKTQQQHVGEFEMSGHHSKEEESDESMATKQTSKLHRLNTVEEKTATKNKDKIKEDADIYGGFKLIVAREGVHMQPLSASATLERT